MELPLVEPLNSNLDAETFTKYLRNHHPCFGHFARTAPECKRCLLPCRIDDRLYLLREVCRGAVIRPLTSDMIRERIERGSTVQDLFDDMVSAGDPAKVAGKIRAILAARFRYLESRGFPTPHLPAAKELLAETKKAKARKP